MVMRRPCHFVLAASLLGCLVCFVPASAGKSPDVPCPTYLPGRFSEFLIQTDGSIILFPADYRGVTQVWNGEKWREETKLATEGIVRDAIRMDNEKWRLVSQVSNQEVVLYEYSHSKLQLLGRLLGSFEKPTLHQARDGCLWVTSGEGRAYGLKDGKAFTHEFGPEVNKKSGCYTYYPSTLSLDVPGQGLWFWSHVQHEALNFGGGPRPAIDSFQIYHNGDWRAASHGGGKLGGAVLWNSDTVLAGSRYKGMFSVDAGDGEIREMDWQLPPDEHCLFLHRAPEGHVLLITARPSMFLRLTPTHNGYIGQLLAWKDGAVTTLIKGVDFKRAFMDKGRAVADVREGTFIAEAQSGLIFVSSNLGTVKRLDWRYGVPLPNIDRMRSRGQQLCVLDRERGFAILDYPALLRAHPVPSSRQWSIRATASPPAVASDGSLWYLAASEPPHLIHWAGTNETQVSLEGSAFPAKSLWYMTTDTKGRMWLISNHETHRTAFLDSGTWRTFELRETAYSTVALEEAGNPEYRIGSPADHCYPAFAGDGRVAYENEWNRVCVFDGEKWDDGYDEGKIHGRSPDGPPFYRAGILTVRAGDGYYEYLNGQWQTTHADVRSPYDDHPRGNYDNDIPRTYPGDTSKAGINVRDNQGAKWVGDADALWRGLNDIWVPFAVRGSPIGMASGVKSVQVDGAGSIWFALGGGDYTRLARYQPDGPSPTVAWVATPPVNLDTGTLECAVQITGSDTNFIVQHQVDDGPWQQTSITQQLHAVRSERIPGGIHGIRVRVFDGLLRASNLLEHRFSVTRNYGQEIRNWTPLLLSSDFSQRELAAKELVSIGHPALPALRVMEHDSDPGQRWWLRAVIEEIERNKDRVEVN